MKGLRGLFRLGTLTLLALMLTVALVLPSSAATIDKVCSSSQMLSEVTIVAVDPEAVEVSWRPQDLVNFDYNGDIKNGLLKVTFKDIPTAEEFDGYVIEATPGDDDPGDSNELGVKAYTSSTLIDRPSVIGAEHTEILNLEPGTKYYVTVYAVNHNTVQISPKQRPQDQNSATTFLSAPFLGALDWGPTLHSNADANNATPTTSLGTTSGECQDGTTLQAVPTAPAVDNRTCKNGWRLVNLADDDFKGAHFALYGVENEAGQHYFRWLNPADWGPFDHMLDKDKGKQADMLSFDDDGDVEDHCVNDDIGKTCGHTLYQFVARDGKGDVVASELVKTKGEFTAGDDSFFQTVFTAESEELNLYVSLGREVDGKYRAMSDTAYVQFDAPDDLRALDQTYDEYNQVNMDITAGVDDTDDVDRYRDSVFAALALTGYDRRRTVEER